MAIDTDDEYNVVAQPRTKKGNAIVWQFEVYDAGEAGTGTGSHWADYAANYNMVLEAAYAAMQPVVRITGPENVPGGFLGLQFEEVHPEELGDGRRAPRETSGGHATRCMNPCWEIITMADAAQVFASRRPIVFFFGLMHALFIPADAPR